jgi:hypothetical protein
MNQSDSVLLFHAQRVHRQTRLGSGVNVNDPLKDENRVAILILRSYFRKELWFQQGFSRMWPLHGSRGGRYARLGRVNAEDMP